MGQIIQGAGANATTQVWLFITGTMAVYYDNGSTFTAAISTSQYTV